MTRPAASPLAPDASAVHEALFQSAGLAIVAAGADGIITHFNPAAERMFGWRASEAIGHLSPVQFHDPAELGEQKRRLGLKRGRPFSSDQEFFVELVEANAAHATQVTYVRRDGTRFPGVLTLTILRDQAEHLTGFVGIIDDITATKRASDLLRASEDRFRTLAEFAPVGIFLSDREGRCVYSNPRGQELAGVSAEEMLGFGWARMIHPDDLNAVQNQVEACLRTGEPFSAEYRVGDATAFRWVHARAQMLLNTGGEGTGFVGIMEDVTERKLAHQETERSLDEKETLLREIHHRVKNNLQIISSLLHFQAKRASDPKDIAVFQEGRDRLRSMILVHEGLYRSRDLSHVDFCGYIRGLVNELSTSYAVARERVTIDLDLHGGDVEIDRALPLGMITNELLTNAFKYAFPDGRRGRVGVHVISNDEGLRLTVSDDGVGVPEGVSLEQPTSFGWQLVRNLAGQLGAEVAHVRSPGTTVVVSVPSRGRAG